jgi:hypothetical protein
MGSLMHLVSMTETRESIGRFGNDAECGESRSRSRGLLEIGAVEHERHERSERVSVEEDGTMKSDLKDADSEVFDYFTHALDVSGQSYEPNNGGVTDPEAALVEQTHRRQLARIEKIRATMWEMTANDARTLAEVYSPYGLPDLRSFALQPSWGHGTFVRLALRLPAAVMAFRVANPTIEPLPELVGGWLRDQAGKGRAVEGMFRRLREACEKSRSRSLRTYLELMVARDRRAARERLEAQHAGLRGQLVGWRGAA